MAGIDITNQFPNSMMANAVRLGQSRFISVDQPSTYVGEQNNVAIATASPLTIPNFSDKYGTYPAPYAAITAIGGPLYYTLDGSVPSATNYAGRVAQDGTVYFNGKSLASIRVFGTTMSVLYLR